MAGMKITTNQLRTMARILRGTGIVRVNRAYKTDDCRAPRGSWLVVTVNGKRMILDGRGRIVHPTTEIHLHERPVVLP